VSRAASGQSDRRHAVNRERRAPRSSRLSGSLSEADGTPKGVRLRDELSSNHENERLFALSWIHKSTIIVKEKSELNGMFTVANRPSSSGVRERAGRRAYRHPPLLCASRVSGPLILCPVAVAASPAHGRILPSATSSCARCCLAQAVDDGKTEVTPPLHAKTPTERSRKELISSERSRTTERRSTERGEECKPGRSADLQQLGRVPDTTRNSEL
jgi:hypothetical protein